MGEGRAQTLESCRDMDCNLQQPGPPAKPHPEDRAGVIAQQLIVPSASAEDPSSIPRTHSRWLIVFYNFSSTESDPTAGISTHMANTHKGTHVHSNQIILFKKKLKTWTD